MARKIQHRRGNQEQNDLFTGAPGEITFDSDLKTLRIHDGETTGGTKLLNETLASQKYTKIDLSNVSTTGKDFISSLGMPCSRSINLELQASASRYTAPANGYFVISLRTVNNNYGSVQLTNETSRVGMQVQNYGTTNAECRCFCPVQKGQKAILFYGGSITSESPQEVFKFVYAEGAI